MQGANVNCVLNLQISVPSYRFLQKVFWKDSAFYCVGLLDERFVVCCHSDIWHCGPRLHWSAYDSGQRLPFQISYYKRLEMKMSCKHWTKFLYFTVSDRRFDIICNAKMWTLWWTVVGGSTCWWCCWRRLLKGRVIWVSVVCHSWHLSINFSSTATRPL